MINRILAFLGLSYYSSGLDNFLTGFDKTHSLSASQRKEREKYAKIYAQRDNANLPPPKETFWEQF